MNDTTGKTASSLAITEKRTQRPGGGCIGIFFQLFDWNRRFAKKKLFSKKLLPPARAKQASKRFGCDEKLPKLRLIADENSGGFPNVKKNGTRVVDSEQKHAMRAPSLVARLMGLESMPSVPPNKLKNASSSELGVDSGEKFLSDHRVFVEEDQNLEKGGTKHELRPQKLQKTGPLERLPVTRFGAEALQFKNVLSRSRKHPPKLVSPVKSPKSLSARNASRLYGAATRILEPGLQSRNRMKCALTYSNTIRHATTDEVMLEATRDLSPDVLTSSNYYASAARSLKGHSSCRNCGNVLDIVDTRPNVEELSSVFVSPVSKYVNPSSQGSERNKPRSPMSSLEQEKKRVFQKDQEHLASLVAQVTDNMRPHAEHISDRMPLDREGQIQWHMMSQQGKPQKDSSSSMCSKAKTQRQSQVWLARDRIPPKSKLCNLHRSRVASATNAINETKDFIALNRSLSGQTRSRMPPKVDYFKFDAERKFGNRRDDSLSQVRKRRSMNVGRQGESSGFINSTFDKQRNISCHAMTGKEMGRNVHSTNRTCIKSRLVHLEGNNRTSGRGNKDNDVISFTFSSPVKHKSGIPAEWEKSRDQNDSTCNSAPQKNPMLDENDGMTCFQKLFPLRGDSLGALLEQKLKELTIQEDDESALGVTLPRRTSAMILQELISALTAEKPHPQEDVTVRSNRENVSCHHHHVTNTNITFQAKPKIAETPFRYSHDKDHHSPGSVLEASFSNDSCFSGSLDDVSGHKLRVDYMDCSYTEPQLLDPDADLLDSATSLNKGRTDRELMTDVLSHISEALSCIDLADTQLKGSKFTHAKEVILNAELMFGNAILHSSHVIKDFSVSRFLIDELETLASVLWMNFSSFLGFEDAKGNLLKGFLFDCVVEYLDSSYGQYSKSGSKAWTRLPLCMNSEILICEIVEEVRRWTGLVGLIPDEIIEREMSYCLGKWTDFGIEAFETGIEIDGDILEILVDDIVEDLWESSLGSS